MPLPFVPTFPCHSLCFPLPECLYCQSGQWKFFLFAEICCVTWRVLEAMLPLQRHKSNTACMLTSSAEVITIFWFFLHPHPHQWLDHNQLRPLLQTEIKSSDHKNHNLLHRLFCFQPTFLVYLLYWHISKRREYAVTKVRKSQITILLFLLILQLLQK